jgi:hypothetical protein
MSNTFEVLSAIDANLAEMQERVGQKIWRRRLAGETVDAGDLILENSETN